MIDFHLHLKRERGWLDGILRQYDGAGVEKGVAFGLGDPLGELSNLETLRICAAHKDRLIPFAFFRLGKDPAKKVAQLADMGFRGLKTTWPTGPYDSERFWPVYAAAERASLPILFHSGIVMRSAADREQPVSSLWMRPGCLDLVARRFPRLQIVAAHLGGPWFDEAYMMARVHPNVWLDVSSGSGWKSKSMDGRYFREKLGWWDGWTKLLFACDHPHTRLSVADAVREWKAILSIGRAAPHDAKRLWSENAKYILS